MDVNNKNYQADNERAPLLGSNNKEEAHTKTAGPKIRRILKEKKTTTTTAAAARSNEDINNSDDFDESASPGIRFSSPFSEARSSYQPHHDDALKGHDAAQATFHASSLLMCLVLDNPFDEQDKEFQQRKKLVNEEIFVGNNNNSANKSSSINNQQQQVQQLQLESHTLLSSSTTTQKSSSPIVKEFLRRHNERVRQEYLAGISNGTIVKEESSSSTASPNPEKAREDVVNQPGSTRGSSCVVDVKGSEAAKPHQQPAGVAGDKKKVNRFAAAAMATSTAAAWKKKGAKVVEAGDDKPIDLLDDGFASSQFALGNTIAESDIHLLLSTGTLNEDDLQALLLADDQQQQQQQAAMKEDEEYSAEEVGKMPAKKAPSLAALAKKVSSSSKQSATAESNNAAEDRSENGETSPSPLPPIVVESAGDDDEDAGDFGFCATPTPKGGLSEKKSGWSGLKKNVGRLSAEGEEPTRRRRRSTMTANKVDLIAASFVEALQDTNKSGAPQTLLNASFPIPGATAATQPNNNTPAAGVLSVATTKLIAVAHSNKERMRRQKMIKRGELALSVSGSENKKYLGSDEDDDETYLADNDFLKVWKGLDDDRRKQKKEDDDQAKRDGAESAKKKRVRSFTVADKKKKKKEKKLLSPRREAMYPARSSMGSEAVTIRSGDEGDSHHPRRDTFDESTSFATTTNGNNKKSDNRYSFAPEYAAVVECESGSFSSSSSECASYSTSCCDTDDEGDDEHANQQVLSDEGTTDGEGVRRSSSRTPSPRRSLKRANMFIKPQTSSAVTLRDLIAETKHEADRLHRLRHHHKTTAPTKFQKVIEILLRFKKRKIEYFPKDALIKIEDPSERRYRRTHDRNYFHGYCLNQQALLLSADEDEIYFKLNAERQTLLDFAQRQGITMVTNKYSFAGGSGVTFTHDMDNKLGRSVDLYRKCYPIPDDFIDECTNRGWGFRVDVPQKMRLETRLLREAWQYGGCGIPIQEMKAKQILVRNFFPLHNQEYLEQKGLNEWATIWALFSRDPLKQNLISIVRYYGEEVSLYFLWVKEYGLFLRYPAVLGATSGILDVCGISTSIVNALFGIFLVLWAFTWCRKWRQVEMEYESLLGQSVEEEQQLVRDEFKPDGEPIPVTVQMVMEKTFQYPITLVRKSDGTMEELTANQRKRKLMRLFVTYPIIVVLTLMLVSALTVITIWRMQHIDDMLITYGASAATTLTGVIFGKLFDSVVPLLNSLENNRTDDEEDNQVVVKSFFFYFFSSYFAMFSIMLYPTKSPNTKILAELANQMLFITVVKPTVQNFQELALPKINQDIRQRVDLTGSYCKAFASYLCCSSTSSLENRYSSTYVKDDPAKMEGERLWRESQMEPYTSTSDDYLEITLQFGFMCMFATTFPWAGLATLFYTVLELRIDAIKLTHFMQRPLAHTAKSIGAWYPINWFLCGTSIITNAYLMFVLSPLPTKIPFLETSLESRYLYCGLMQYALLALMAFIYVVMGNGGGGSANSSKNTMVGGGNNSGDPDAAAKEIVKHNLLRDKGIRMQLMTQLRRKANDHDTLPAGSSAQIGTTLK